MLVGAGEVSLAGWRVGLHIYTDSYMEGKALPSVAGRLESKAKRHEIGHRRRPRRVLGLLQIPPGRES